MPVEVKNLKASIILILFPPWSILLFNTSTSASNHTPTISLITPPHFSSPIHKSNPKPTSPLLLTSSGKFQSLATAMESAAVPAAFLCSPRAASSSSFLRVPATSRNMGFSAADPLLSCHVASTVSSIQALTRRVAQPAPTTISAALEKATTESQAAIRFGIIGAADIARKVSRAITLAPNSIVTAVASRSLEKATNFAKANNFPLGTKVYGSYEALLDDPDIDAVYLPLPTSMHVEWAVLVAQKKKHLLMEKPVALNVAEFDVIVKACEENGVQLMDGAMWVHHPRTAQMKEFVSDPQRFGQLKTMHSCFSFAGDANFLKNDIRVKPDLDGLGALGDAGWYCIRSILWANDYELPKTVIAMHGPILNEAGVILSCGASLYWDDGRIATFSCSFLANLTMNVTVIGTKGTLELHDFIIPFREKEASYIANSNCFFNELVTGWVLLPTEHIVTTDIPQEACMVREFSLLVANIKNGSKPEQKWPIISRKTQLIVDAVRTSIDRGFEPIEIKW